MRTEVMKARIRERNERQFIAGRREVGREKIKFLRGSQTSPYRYSDISSLKVKILAWLEAVASDRGPRILIF
jgi:hypothetical protein